MDLADGVHAHGQMVVIAHQILDGNGSVAVHLDNQAQSLDACRAADASIEMRVGVEATLQEEEVVNVQQREGLAAEKHLVL